MLTVFVELDGKPVFEVLKNQPVDNPISKVTKTFARIVTVSDRETKRFLYKIRPRSKTSVAFGTLTGRKIKVRITDRMIQVGKSRIENNIFNGVMAGVVLRQDGGMAIGAPLPPLVVEMLTQD